MLQVLVWPLTIAMKNDRDRELSVTNRLDLIATLNCEILPTVTHPRSDRAEKLVSVIVKKHQSQFKTIILDHSCLKE